ncbi:MAG: hypothetical protein J0I77_06655 [Rudaea sp.]|uniref:protein-disulfide reductase DsbD domain-containing protein n=1 Tax=unclassified Rudaea TaxID=2627037 RepID=UPI0010FA30E1|nr:MULTISPECIES: protein-disulfide reductase DsbD domain-containing protein [unclassified Rudaea]MBN8885381.1 hypothetical protein [Rudaea sp.]MBR0345959.1 hypothetical protein [Rudaea sp.]
MRLSNVAACFFLACFGLGGLAFAAPVSADHIEVELVSENSALVPGHNAWLGLRLKHEPGWHTYWINPGDSGLPTKLSWTLPTGFKADPIAWPTPKRFQLGELYNFGYELDALLPVSISVPAEAAIGSTVQLGVEAKWLVCHEECVPGKANLRIDLPLAAKATPDPAFAAAFAAAHAAQPAKSASKAQARLIGDRVEVALDATDLRRPPTDAFAAQTKVVANAPPTIAERGGKSVLTFAKSDYFTAAPEHFELLLLDGSAKAVLIDAPFAPAPPSSSSSSTP